MERNPWLSALIILLAVIAGWFLVGELWALAARFADIILLFFLAWLLAFTLSPVARLLSGRAGLPRIVAVVIVYLGLVLLVLVGTVMLIPVVTLQLSQLGANFAAYGDHLPGWVDAVQGELQQRNINVDLYGFYRQQDLSAQVERVGTLLIQNAISVLAGVASAMFAMILVLVLSFYIMVDGGRLLRQVVGAVPPHLRSEVQFLLESIERTFGGFIRGQLIQCGIYALGTAIIMYGGGLDYVLVSSLFAGAILVIPFIGPFLAMVPPLVIAALLGSLAKFIVVAVALLVLQQLVINVIAPKLLSETVGLPPLLVILAILLGAKLAGVVGAIFGVPVAAVIYAMLLFLYRRSSLAEAATVAHGETLMHSETLWQSEPAAAEDHSTGWLVRQGHWIGEYFAKRRGRRQGLD